MHFLLRGPFGDVELKTCWLQLLSFRHYLLLSKFSIYFTCLNLIVTPITLYLFWSKYKYEIITNVQICICDIQCYSFGRIYKYKRTKYQVQKKITNAHAIDAHNFIPTLPLKVKLVAKNFIKNMSKQAFIANFHFSRIFVEVQK